MSNAIIPIPRCEVSIRSATMDDLPFIDRLQKANSKQLGFMPTKQLEGKILAGHVIVAEESGMGLQPMSGGEDTGCKPVPRGERLGYCIGNDKYFKHDDIGIIYQLNVVPSQRRSLVGATLIKAIFDRAAYGCKLFCCWCAQDIEANYFWESLGFIPLAFRTGSAKKARTHIFWQKRIREGDSTTPFWFPSQTNAGAIREDRLVLPLPPGTHWKDAKPLILPTVPAEPIALPAPRSRAPKAAPSMAPGRSGMTLGWTFIPPKPSKAEKPKRKKPPKVKNDPAHVAAARELRDRYLEQFNAGMLLPGGKYEVTRRIEAPTKANPLLLENTAANARAA